MKLSVDIKVMWNKRSGKEKANQKNVIIAAPTTNIIEYYYYYYCKLFLIKIT